MLAYNVSNVSKKLKEREKEILIESKKLEIKHECNLKRIKLCNTTLAEDNKISSTTIDQESNTEVFSADEIHHQNEENLDQILGALTDNS